MVYNIQAFEPGFWNSILDRKKGSRQFDEPNLNLQSSLLTLKLVWLLSNYFTKMNLETSARIS